MAFDPITAGFEVGGKILDIVKGYFPGKLSPDQEAQIEAAANAEFRSFVVQYEGSAEDYKNIPVIGPIVLLFRGLIRPAFTVAVMYADFIYFQPSSVWSGAQSDLLWLVNLLVLGFWFGERAIKNTGAADILKSWLLNKKEK